MTGDRSGRVTPARAALGALVLTQVAHGAIAEVPSPAATRRMLTFMLGVSALEAGEAAGVRRGLCALATAGSTGFAAELAGVATGRPFGRYAYSEQLGRRVCGVPVLAAAAWAIMARPAWVTAGWVSPRPVVRVPIAAAALTGWDVYLDPRMAAQGYWTWSSPGRYEGIPASNYLGWLTTGVAAFALLCRLDPAPPRPRDDGAFALYAWTWIGEGVANALLWRRKPTAAAGAAAMGTFALPALRQRLHR